MIRFMLDGRAVEARPGESIWQVAKRLGTEIPHLCYTPQPGYRADGNCRACMVEIAGERVLAPSCKRMPTEGMQVSSESARAKRARELVFELLLADQPPREMAHDAESKFWRWAEKLDIAASRFPARDHAPPPDRSHVAMAVNLDACIQCNLCVRACREVQGNDVIGMAFRGHHSEIVFDLKDPMGSSTCVACGECVQACPTGALLPSVLVDEHNKGVAKATEQVDSLCPFCGVG
ncbi:2Fe-2S iron-sulfur cluster-binding protein, partial [Ferrovibrio sp.]